MKGNSIVNHGLGDALSMGFSPHELVGGRVMFARACERLGAFWQLPCLMDRDGIECNNYLTSHHRGHLSEAESSQMNKKWHTGSTEIL